MGLIQLINDKTCSKLLDNNITLNPHFDVLKKIIERRDCALGRILNLFYEIKNIKHVYMIKYS